MAYDEGSESRDGCFNSKVGYPQGVFRPQLGDGFQQVGYKAPSHYIIITLLQLMF